MGTPETARQHFAFSQIFRQTPKLRDSASRFPKSPARPRNFETALRVFPNLPPDPEISRQRFAFSQISRRTPKFQDSNSRFPKSPAGPRNFKTAIRVFPNL